MSRLPLVRRVALTAMALVTAWSVWAWAQPARPAPAPHAVAETAPGAHEGKAEAGESEGPASMNWTEFGGETPPFIAMLINFGILAAGYYLLGRKPIAAGLQARRDSIARDIEEAQRMKHEAEARAQVYQSKLETLEAELARRARLAPWSRRGREASASFERPRRRPSACRRTPSSWWSRS